jgi:hypothetical protein
VFILNDLCAAKEGKTANPSLVLQIEGLVQKQALRVKNANQPIGVFLARQNTA